MAAGVAPHDPSRRAFLRGQRQLRPAHRPPWALTETDFLAACTGCRACVDACPERILRLGAGHLAVVDLGDGGECTFCGDCVDACQPRALDRERGVRSSWQAQVGPGCLAAAGVVCQSCRDACPERAIRFPVAAAVTLPVLAVEACTGCGACLPVCPGQAIELQPRAAA